MEHWLEEFASTGFRWSGDTAHDLKTPLNVAVLNLELLRMRLRKLHEGEDDQKVNEYMRSIEMELRRMARIFDVFFLYSVPPKGEGEPSRVSVGAAARQIALTAELELEELEAEVFAHESRIRHGLKMFFEGARRLFPSERRCRASKAAGKYLVSIEGRPEADFELTKIFKFYYTDALGLPELSLATARLIAETYGGQVGATERDGLVSLEFSLPLGEE